MDADVRSTPLSLSRLLWCPGHRYGQSSCGKEDSTKSCHSSSSPRPWSLCRGSFAASPCATVVSAAAAAAVPGAVVAAASASFLFWSSVRHSLARSMSAFSKEPVSRETSKHLKTFTSVHGHTVYVRVPYLRTKQVAHSTRQVPTRRRGKERGGDTALYLYCNPGVPGGYGRNAAGDMAESCTSARTARERKDFLTYPSSSPCSNVLDSSCPKASVNGVNDHLCKSVRSSVDFDLLAKSARVIWPTRRPTLLKNPRCQLL
jgi:hypothetical protein